MAVGEPAVKIGLVQFGNGVIMEDGSVSAAINAHALDFDRDSLTAAVDAMPFKKGFTNMAQAFAMAEGMFTSTQRNEAHQAVLVVTDGKPSFQFMTGEIVRQLSDKNIMRYFVVVSESSMDDEPLVALKGWVNEPWETNIVHIPSLEQLEAAHEVWATKALTKFCSEAWSPHHEEEKTDLLGFKMVKRGAYCGDLSTGELLGTSVLGPDACSGLVQMHQGDGGAFTSFALGTWQNHGYCYGLRSTVTEAEWEGWVHSFFGGDNGQTGPECDTTWHLAMYNFFSLKPVATE